MENESFSFVPIVIAVLIGTGLLLVLIKFNARRVWKIWFFAAISYVLFIALKPFIDKITIPLFSVGSEWIAFAICLVLAFFKAIRPNVYVHNFTELFLYGGMAAIFVDFLNLWSASILLILISIYDIIAVWKSKHMVKLANFQTDSKVFAGLFIPYSLKKNPMGNMPKPPKPTHEKHKTKKSKNAILGGGDIAFPLFFAGAVMKAFGFGMSFIIVGFTTVALGYLLFKAEQDKFYPAMPFLSAGCFGGLAIVLLLSLI